jgi:hypothetical protein
MGTIYASAHATIIAVVGEDPSYRLPGISRHLDTTQRFILEHHGTPAHLIHQSQWASRVRISRESYLKSRQSFFAKTGVNYACEQ